MRLWWHKTDNELSLSSLNMATLCVNRGLLHRSPTRVKAGEPKARSGSFSVPLIPAALLRATLRAHYASFSSEAQRQTPEGLRVDRIWFLTSKQWLFPWHTVTILLEGWNMFFLKWAGRMLFPINDANTVCMALGHKPYGAGALFRSMLTAVRLRSSTQRVSSYSDALPDE